MFIIPGYEIREKLYEGPHSLVYRALRKQDNQSVIVKLLKEEYPSLDDISRFKREVQITQMVAGEGVPKVCGLEKVGQSFAMILEDIGARSLDEILSSRRLSLKESLSIAIQVAHTLARIHDKPVIHKDINPSNIIWNSDTGSVQLIDFGISFTLPRETQAIVIPKLLEGTLAYISPEQTGRMNRTIDERTDYYSLGCTLYQMLTGILPFKSDDPMELIHLHIAKQPESPTALDPQIPEILSEIVLKLMAKTVEDRYQGARGLEFDLVKCLDAFKMVGKIEPFALGTHDISDRFEISGKLYGRKEELAELFAMFDLASKGEVGLLLVGGFPGIGKTSLVLEVHKPIVEKRGIFISGKFDQYKQVRPYWGIVQALEDWIKQILMEGTD